MHSPTHNEYITQLPIGTPSNYTSSTTKIIIIILSKCALLRNCKKTRQISKNMTFLFLGKQLLPSVYANCKNDLVIGRYHSRYHPVTGIADRNKWGFGTETCFSALWNCVSNSPGKCRYTMCIAPFWDCHPERGFSCNPRMVGPCDPPTWPRKWG